MYNPFPYDDPKPVNRPELSEKTITSLVSGGTANVARVFAGILAGKAKDGPVVVGFDGYTTASWDLFLNLLNRELYIKGIGLETMDINAGTFKDSAEIDALVDPMLSWDTKSDPTLLFGRIWRKGYQGILDPDKVKAFLKLAISKRIRVKYRDVYGKKSDGKQTIDHPFAN